MHFRHYIYKHVASTAAYTSNVTQPTHLSVLQYIKPT